MKWSNDKSTKPVLIIWPDISWRQVNRAVIVRPCSGPVWRCTASGRSRCTGSHHARGPRWRRLPPDRWGRGNCGCRCRRRAPLPPDCSEERTSSAPLDWKAVENQENVRNGRRRTGSSRCVANLVKLQNKKAELLTDLKKPSVFLWRDQFRSRPALPLLPWRWVFWSRVSGTGSPAWRSQGWASRQTWPPSNLRSSWAEYYRGTRVDCR